MRSRPAPFVVKSGSCPTRATVSSDARSNASSRLSERAPGRRGRRSCRSSAAVKNPCTLFSRERPSAAHDASAIGPLRIGHGGERFVQLLQAIVGLTGIHDQNPQPGVPRPRKRFEDRFDREEMPAPEDQEQVEVRELATVREVRIDGRRAGLRSGEAAVALDAPVAKLREGPGDRRTRRAPPIESTRRSPHGSRRSTAGDSGSRVPPCMATDVSVSSAPGLYGWLMPLASASLKPGLCHHPLDRVDIDRHERRQVLVAPCR